MILNLIWHTLGIILVLLGIGVLIILSGTGGDPPPPTVVDDLGGEHQLTPIE